MLQGVEKQNSNVAVSYFSTKKEQAIIVWLESLDNNVKAEKAVDQLTVTELNADNGMEALLNKLDSVFHREAID